MEPHPTESVEAPRLSISAGPSAEQRLADIASALKDARPVEQVSVRTFLSWFGTYRRGFYKVRMIRAALTRAALTTTPDFETAYIDAPIAFSFSPVSGAVTSGARVETAAEGMVLTTALGTPTIAVESATMAALLGGAVADPTYRIGKLAAANKPPLSVKPDATLQEAITLMLSHDYSQLPVMQSERTVKGVVTWQSIGARLVLNCGGSKVSDFVEPPREISADASIFAAIGVVVDSQYVLIRDAQQRIGGIVTSTDLSLQFGQLAEPFLLLGEIENHIRRLIDGKFTSDEVKAVQDENDTEREVNSVADLTFGEYVRLLEHPARWDKLGLALDRAVFSRQLNRVREIRNDVMHFDPDGASADDLETLRQFARLLQTLREIGAT